MGLLVAKMATGKMFQVDQKYHTEILSLQTDAEKVEAAQTGERTFVLFEFHALAALLVDVD